MKKIRRRGRKILSILLSMTMAAGMMLTGITPGTNEVKAASSLTSADFLKTNGTSIRKNYGNGEKVYLRGTNAGGWLVQENWMNPTNAPDQRTMMDTLANRFGTSTRDSLVAAYEDNYWTTQDFDNCAAMGMSVIRLPFTYMNLCDDNGNLKSNAWRRLDWFVSNCSSRGMYVILDMHGAFGSQNGMDHSGEVNDGKQLYYNQGNKNKTLNLWAKIAEHFKGNPAVAAYDILNEPGIKAAATYSLHWDFYNEIYKTIRSKDSNHIIIMESCWDADNLPRPSAYGWTNVAYEYHYYPWNYISNSSGQASYTAGKVRDIANHNYGVPTFVGEFTCFDQEDAWRNTMSTYNQQGWHWTTWAYKVTGNSSWGIYNHSPQSVDIYNDSADTIRKKWSSVGTDKGWVNSKIYNVVKSYLLGTVTPGDSGNSDNSGSSDNSDNSGNSGSSHGVTFYEHSNYGGWAVTLGEGWYTCSQIEAAGIRNDQITSVKVPAGYVVTLYEHDNYEGAQKVLTGNTSLLSDFNDKTSSIRIVYSGSSAGTSHVKPGDSGNSDNSGNSGSSHGVTFYEHSNYGGWAVTLGEGWYTCSQIEAAGIRNDQITSVKVPAGYVVTLYEHDNYEGAQKVLTENTSLLSDFNDKTSSIRIVYSGSSAGTSYSTTKLSNGKYYIQSIANDKVVCAENGGSDPLMANRDSYSGAWETLFIENNNDGTVSLKAEANNKYVCAVLDEQNQLLPRSDSPSTWEKFQIYKIKDGEYGIRCVDNGKYVKADLDNGGKLVATSDSIAGAWEAFRIVKVKGSASVKPVVENGEYYFTSIANGGVVCAENGGSDPLIANRESCGGAWESIKIENNGDGTVSLKSSANGKYVCAVVDEQNQLLPRSSSASDWEKFEIVEIQNGEYALKARANNKYVKADLDNGGKLVASSDSVAGAWEAFKITKTGESSGLTYSGSEKKAEFYLDSDYNGTKVSLSAGKYDYNAMVSAGIKNDALSSVKVPDGYRVTLYNDAGFQGGAKVLLQDTSNLGGFNDKTSSIIIEKVERPNFNNADTYITSIANNKVVCAENGGNDTIVANRGSCGGAWETIQIVNNNDGTVSLRSAANGKYVCAIVDEHNQLVPRSGSIGTWEKFIIEKIADNEYAIYSLANGKYVQANMNDGGKLYAGSDTVADSWEAFRITKIQ